MTTLPRGLLRFYKLSELRRIQKSKVGIGGAGGLGSNIAIALVRSGFQHFEILDHDRVTASNLNRQAYLPAHAGQYKVTALRDILLQIDPDAKIVIHRKKWSANSAEDIFKGCDVIVEAFDTASGKRSFVEYYQDRASLIVSGNGMAGHVLRRALEIKKIGNVYFVGDRKTEVSRRDPPLAPRVMACAGLMAGIVLEHILNKD